MSFDPAFLFLSLLPSGIGLVLFMYGKKYLRWPQLAAGVLLMVSPYVVSTVMSLITADVAIGVALWFALHLGW
jgi:hypothetical protein